MCFSLLLTAVCANFRTFLLVPAFVVGITLPEKFAFKRQLLRREITSQYGLCMLSSRRSRKFRGPVWFDNPAFGGRGASLVHNRANKFKGPICVGNAALDELRRRLARNCVTDRTAIQLGFDATLGYPGEGWSQDHPNLKITTWNTRSLTFERFD